MSAGEPRSGVRFDVEGPVATITLDRPGRRNSQTPALWAELARIGAEEVGDEVRVVVVKGAGETFSAGLDTALLSGSPVDELPVELADELGATASIPALMAESPEVVLERIAEFQQGFAWLRDPRFVAIAAVQGYAIGGGFQLALACDLRVVANDVRFCMKEPALGIVPDLGGTKPLVEAVGYARALEICVTGRYIGGAESVAIGLATAAVPVLELDDAVEDLVQAILALPSGAVRETTALLRDAGGRTWTEQCAAEREAQVRRFADLRNPERSAGVSPA